MDSNLQALSEEEIMDIDGGIAWIPVIIIGGAVVCFGVGVYNGYCEAVK